MYGGPLYDMELPVVLLNVQIMDDVCHNLRPQRMLVWFLVPRCLGRLN